VGQLNRFRFRAGFDQTDESAAETSASTDRRPTGQNQFVTTDERQTVWRFNAARDENRQFVADDERCAAQNVVSGFG